jgi:PAS domain S-box-containing protein
VFSRYEDVGLRDENLQAALLNQIDASVIVTDMGGTVISWNRGAETLYGWSTAEAVGCSARDLVVPEDPAEAEQLMAEVRRNGRWDGELRVRRKDGSNFNVHVRNRLIRDEHGEPWAIIGLAVDISERVAIETELLQSRDYARAVTECMGEGLLTVGTDSRITYINPTGERCLGYPDGGLLGTRVDDVLSPARTDGSGGIEDASPIRRALEAEETVRVEDGSFRTSSGRALPVAYTAAPFHTHAGRQGCVVIFQDISERKLREEEQRKSLHTLECINRVEAAIMEDRFVLHAQPIVDLRTGATVQHELLLRMREPDGRIVAPDEFLPIAEQYALIGEIDWWVIKQATALAGTGCPVQLNLSARSVGDLDVLEHIERSIAQHEVAPGLLVFEITETAIVEEEDAARGFAERLQELGCKIALDDFGTGYGTLTYLKRIPVNFLKLDIEFVRDLATDAASRSVVRAVLTLAHDFGLQTVAEGVEDAETLELLRSIEVDFAQGYHLARPVPFDERPGDRSVPVRLVPSRSARPLQPHLTPAGRRHARRPVRASAARRARAASRNT